MIHGGPAMLGIDLFEAIGRFLSKSPFKKVENPYKGTVGSTAFFKDLKAGDKSALDSLDKSYGNIWKKGGAGWKGRVEREMTKDAGKSVFQRPIKGALFGRAAGGANRALGNLSPAALKMAAATGLLYTALTMGQAKRGDVIASGVGGLGSTVGGVTGATIGAFFGGLPGEVIGGAIGGAVGEKLSEIPRTLLKIGKRAHSFNAGGDYKDTEQSYTMRQRAAQELSTSVLNARQYLGKESALMHS